MYLMCKITRLKTYLRNDAQSLQNERDEIFTDVSLKLENEMFTTVSQKK